MPPQPNSPSSVCGASTSARLTAVDHRAGLQRCGARDRDQREQAPERAGPRRARCRRGCARGSRPRLVRTRAGRAPSKSRPRRAERRARAPRRRASRRGSKPGEPGLGGDGDRRRVRRGRLRLLAAEVRQVGVRALKPPMPTPITGWWYGDLDARSRRASSGRSSRATATALLADRGATAAAERDAEQHRDGDATSSRLPPPPGDHQRRRRSRPRAPRSSTARTTAGARPR